MFQAFAFTLAEAVAFNQVGDWLGDGTEEHPFANLFGLHSAAVIVAHGLVGGLFSIGQKGGFSAGFLAAGLGALADTAEIPGSDPDAIAFDTVEHAIAGGVGPTLGGGKFGNGAITGAFGYLFNQLKHLGDTVDIGGHAIPKSLLMTIQQDIASRSAQVAGKNQANEWEGYIKDDLTYVMWEGRIANGGPNQDIPDGAIIQFHSHPPFSISAWTPSKIKHRRMHPTYKT